MHLTHFFPYYIVKPPVLFGDNFWENKNNTNVDFLLELIWRGWYDEIHLLFAPVGHTHNGVDAAHRVHNNDCGKHAAGTLGEWAGNFTRVFNKNDVPNPKYMRSVYDFDGRYERMSEHVKGYSKTRWQEEAVHAFKFKRDIENNVSMFWAHHATCATDQWRGATGSTDDRVGLCKLFQLPNGPLQPMRTVYDCIPDDAAKDLNSSKLPGILNDEKFHPGTYEWLQEAVSLGCLPLGDQVAPKPGDINCIFTVGVAPRTCDMEVYDLLPDDVMEPPDCGRPVVLRPPERRPLPVSTCHLLYVVNSRDTITQTHTHEHLTHIHPPHTQQPIYV